MRRQNPEAHKKRLKASLQAWRKADFLFSQWKGYNKRLAEQAETDKKAPKPIKRKYLKGLD